MMPDYIEVRESYFKMPDGSVVMLRQIGDRLEWHGKVPILFVEWAKGDWPWDRYGDDYANAARALRLDESIRRAALGIMTMQNPKEKYWWDGSCLVMALVKEGPKAIVKWRA